MWYKRNFRRNLIDMHIPDWDLSFLSRFDPEAYADAVAASGVDTAIIYAGNCLGMCFWPSRLGHMHENLHGRDIFGETVAACRRRGLKIVGYYNIWNRYEYDHHPEWRMRDINGQGSYVDGGQRFGVCCPNTGYRDFVRGQIEDLCSHYEFDGLWVDMIGWTGCACYCDDCREAYRRETGLELPETVDFADPAWVRFQRSRQAWVTDFSKMVVDTAKAAQPGISVTLQSASCKGGWRDASPTSFFALPDYLAVDLYLEPWEEAFICKLLRALSNTQPVEFMVSSCVDLNEHTTRKPLERLSMQSKLALAHQCAFVFIDAIDPIGTVNRPLYDSMHSILSNMEPYLAAVQPDWKLKADVGIWYNLDNMTDRDQLALAYQVSHALIQSNISFDVVTARQRDSLNDYKVIILSDVEMLDAAEVQALRRFVQNGGKLYASGHTGTIDGSGGQNGDFLLADVLGVHRTGESTWPLSYMAPTAAGQPLFDYYRPDYPLCIPTQQVTIAADTDVTVLATLAQTVRDPADTNFFSSAISNPPTQFTDSPCLTLHPFGKGAAMYAAGMPEASPYDAQRTVFINLIRSLLEAPSMTSDAPAPVQITTFVSPDGSRMLVSLLNFQQQFPVIPIHGMKVWLDAAGKKVRSAVFAESGLPCPFEEKDGGVELLPAVLDEFAMIELVLG